MRKAIYLALVVVGIHLGAVKAVKALTIQVDYRYDTSGFFSADGNPQGEAGAKLARAAVEAAAARWSAIIDQPLGAVSLADDRDDPRIAFTHPATGMDWQVSPARGPASDSLVQERRPPAPADEYRGGWGIEADVWILYAGGRDLGVHEGLGGTAQGINWLSVYDDPNGPHNRGFNVGLFSLPVWGGSIAFNVNSPYIWNFDHTRSPATAEIDLYSIALHEIGHALGLNISVWEEWMALTSDGFVGVNALAAYNADNGATLDRLLIGEFDHWGELEREEDQYLGKIFTGGLPNYIGTVGMGVPQPLLMGGRLPIGLRYEVTNVEVGALQDIGWSVISAPVVIPVPDMLPEISKAEDGSMSVVWKSVAGAGYTVQTSTDGRKWADVTPPVIARGPVTTWRDGEAGFVDPNPLAIVMGRKYYRIVSMSGLPVAVR